MDKERREALQITKEIIVKFIETQRISPSNFADIFPAVHKVVLRAVREEDDEPNRETSAS